MKKTTLITLSALILSSAALVGCGGGSDKEVVKRETTDTPRIFGGNTHREETVVRDKDTGALSTEKKVIKTP